MEFNNYLKELPSHQKDLKGKSGKIYSFKCYGFEEDLNSLAEIEGNLFYIAKMESKNKIKDVLYFGNCKLVAEIKRNPKVLKLIHNDFDNYAYFVYIGNPIDLKEIKDDIQSNYEFINVFD